MISTVVRWDYIVCYGTIERLKVCVWFLVRFSYCYDIKTIAKKKGRKVRTENVGQKYLNSFELLDMTLQTLLGLR